MYLNCYASVFRHLFGNWSCSSNKRVPGVRIRNMPDCRSLNNLLPMFYPQAHKQTYIHRYLGFLNAFPFYLSEQFIFQWQLSFSPPPLLSFCFSSLFSRKTSKRLKVLEINTGQNGPDRIDVKVWWMSGVNTSGHFSISFHGTHLYRESLLCSCR